MVPSIVKFSPEGGTGPDPKNPAGSPDQIFAKGTPEALGRVLLEDKRYGLAAGVLQTDALVTEPVLRDRHMFCHVQDGDISITAADGARTRFSAGDSFVLPAGTIAAWQQDGPAVIYFVTFKDEAASPGSSPAPAIQIDHGSQLSPSAPPADDLLISPRPTTHIVHSFATADNKWSAGIWDATPYHRKLIPFPRYEFMHILDGSVSFTQADGSTVSFGVGDSFIVPEGAICDWKNERYVRKVFCVYRP